MDIRYIANHNNAVGKVVVLNAFSLCPSQESSTKPPFLNPHNIDLRILLPL